MVSDTNKNIPLHIKKHLANREKRLSKCLCYSECDL